MLKQNIILPDLFTSKEVEAIMVKDAKIVSLPGDTESYKVENAVKYRVLLNTWMYMCSQYVTSRCVNALMSMIRVKGLIPIISECSDLASEIVRSDFTLSDLGSYYFLMNEDPRITLQLLRYPKRFSPCRATKLRDEGLQAFISLNRSLRGTPTVINPQGKVLERDTVYPTALIQSVKGWITEFLYGQAVVAWRPSEDHLLVEGRFSNGVSANGSKTLYEKYREWCELTPGYQDNLMYPVWRFGFHDYGERDDIDYVKAVAVPKSYKTPRIIAEVSAKCQFFQQGIRKWLLKFLKGNAYSDFIVLDDQSINQEWSRLGSIYGTYATIDLSSASDSISRHLAKKVLPCGWFDLIEEFNPPYIMVNGKKEKRNILLTSGSGDTFVVESIIFLAVAFSAWEYVQIMCPDEAFLAPRVYGDDLICDCRCYDTTRDFLQKLGFTVNESKSFSDGRYRESCGAEWFCGLDTSTKYFPRKAYDENSPEFLEGLIALQHRLYEFESCEQWLSAMIKQLYRTQTGGKELTSSYPGTECSDLWADFPYYYTVNPPYDRRGNAEETQRFINVNNIKREAHSALVRKKLTSKEVEKRFLEKHHRPFTWEQVHMMDMFRYVDFLRFGMQYDEYGVPIHQCPVSDDLLEPEVVWTTVTR